MDLLYSFISHNSVIEEDSVRIGTMMESLEIKDYVVCYAGKNKNIKNENVVFLECDDSYCGLAGKINYLCKYVKDKINSDFMVKMDRTITIKKVIKERNLKDYSGKKIHLQNRWFHKNKCIGAYSYWNQKEFDGQVIDYCNGGACYILSKKAYSIVADDNNLYKDNIYEDYYVGRIMLENGINPEFFDVKSHFADDTNPNVFL